MGFWGLVRGGIYSTFYNVSNFHPAIGRPMRWLYNTFRWMWGGIKYPRVPGIIPVGAPTPTAHLNLQAGETVRVKSHDEILKTVNAESKNRGMWWDAEFVPYCGGTYKVLRRVTKIIEEKHGRMVQMKNPCIILEDVVCKARYSNCRMFCPREIYPYWREVWLERIDASKPDGAT